MFKDFFYFNRSQRIGIVVLLVLILVTIVGIYLMPLLFPVQQADDSSFQKEVACFEKSLVDRDSDGNWARSGKGSSRNGNSSMSKNISLIITKGNSRSAIR